MAHPPHLQASDDAEGESGGGLGAVGRADAQHIEVGHVGQQQIEFLLCHLDGLVHLREGLAVPAGACIPSITSSLQFRRWRPSTVAGHMRSSSHSASVPKGQKQSRSGPVIAEGAHMERDMK